ncbi:MAG: ATP-dependent sacrificial sulfur transferase LarE [Candidatus Omnitrophica bacterium]|nr:ATP-dependent sacrificial sulfur transferase LarE [Candidatus Omnitrophota bacterium]MBU1870327.1 ATP-dependent sacrificial sulfur transferase LarE [Candidatus Omnitrophota bacterium]
MNSTYKFKKLKKIISGYGSCLIAYSGGVDSTFLLKAASLALPKDKILAVSANSATYPKEELLFAKRMAKELGIRHKIIQTKELESSYFTFNPINRCYYCKKELFSQLKKIAKEFKLNFVCDASNVSDKLDFRPGNRAKQGLGVRSPLVEAGLSKEDIRKASRKLGLKTWDKPSLACLASRIPYGTKITPKLLDRINQAEVYLRQIGFNQVRLRHYNGLCRIEVLKDDLPRLLKKRNQVIDKLKRLGYNYITLDLEGYRTGSMNEVKNE